MSGATGSTLFRFVQFEFPWVLGPPDGRYVLREQAGEQPQHVVVLVTLGAPQRRLLRARRARRAEPQPDPEPVATARATMIDAEPSADASRWLAALDLDATAAASLAILNRVVHAHRIAAANPYVRELSIEDAIALRAGFGEGEQVADGRWREALERPRAAQRRARGNSALRPQERLAALLGARDQELACEELALRARLDIDHARLLPAALGTRIALETALVELLDSAELPGMLERLDELRRLRDGVQAAAAEALQGRNTDAHTAAVTHALRRVEAALRARTAIGLK